jgi:kinesin family member 17
MNDESIRVVVQCRPLNAREKTSNYKACVRIHLDLCRIEVVRNNSGTEKPLTFDAVYDIDSSRQEVYSDGEFSPTSYLKRW